MTDKNVCPTNDRQGCLSHDRLRMPVLQTCQLIDALAQRLDVALTRRFVVVRGVEGIAELVVGQLRKEQAYPARVYVWDAAHGFLFLDLAPVVRRIKNGEHAELDRKSTRL